MNKKQREAIERGLRVVNIRPESEDQFRRPTLQGGFAVFSRVSSSQKEEKQDPPLSLGAINIPPTPDPRGDIHTPDRQGSEVSPDGRKALTPDGEGLPLTPGEGLPLTPPKKQQKILPPDRQGKGVLPPTLNTLLSPLQWKVFQTLRELEARSELSSYRDIATRVSSTREGVKSAVEVLRKVGAIVDYEVVRTAKTQGVRFRINYESQFQETSLGKSKGLPKRDSVLPLTVGGRREATGTSMYVFINTYIRELLQLFPVEWQIREQTLRQIWELNPTMSRLEFRRSLLSLIEQTKAGPEVKNPNAWLKGAFERNGGPIVTDAMIEDQLDRRAVSTAKAVTLEKDRTVEESEILRRYITASVEERELIDQAAEERIGRLLTTVSPDKHAGIRGQARLECAREFFKKQE